ncbi:RpnC/YadD family protein [Nitrincola alkalisediminis]|uniref:hypothetical protein n=1 Tax=Nitrincola alkalisediminis TaxID=1366656 RepID=UPI0018771905|nr:hypothetical protein [Nitrincola alkalisediminis]
MISADDEERRLAFVRQRAMHDEATLLKEAREGGFEQGIEKGIEQGIEQGIAQGLKKGRQAQMSETALKLIVRTEMDDVMIAELSGLSVGQVEHLRLKANH